jgi:hypothetical protein
MASAGASFRPREGFGARRLRPRGDGQGEVSRAAARLEAGGYIVKEVHLTDHRLVELQLSERGRALVSKIAPLGLACQSEVLSRLSETEQKVFITVVRKLVAPADFGSKGSNVMRRARSSRPDIRKSPI